MNSSAATPSAIVTEVLRLLEAEDYQGAAALHDPGYARFRLAMVQRQARPVRKRPTVEGLLKLYPDMPKAAAEYEVARAENAPPPEPSFDELFGVESASDLADLTPTAALARILQASDFRWRQRAYLDQLALQHPEYDDQLAEQKSQVRYMWSGTVVGHVEHANRAFVVVTSSSPREEYPDDHASRLVVLRRHDGSWGVSSNISPSSGLLVRFHVAVKDTGGNTVVLS